MEDVRNAHVLYMEKGQDGRTAITFDAYVGLLLRAARYLHGEPGSAEVYFLLGEAYAQAGFLPEARSYLRLVMADHPESEWATSALILLKEIEEPVRFDEICEDCVRQYPDTVLALSAWIYLAHKALEEGKGEAIAREVSKLEIARPDMEMVMPLLQDLKARLAVFRKDEEGARQLWLRLANLSTTEQWQASAFFSVAEGLLRSSRPLEARKYYSIIRHRFPNTPESLFSAMRLAQMAGAEHASLLEVTGNLPQDPKIGEDVFRKILERYPGHPLAGEAAVELMRVLLGQGRLQELAERAEDLAGKQPKEPVAGKAVGLVREACDLLSRSQTPLDLFADPSGMGRRFLTSPPSGLLGEEAARLVRIAWLRKIGAMAARGDGFAAAREACEFGRVAPGSAESGQAAAVSSEAFITSAEAFLREGKALHILNEVASLASDGCPVPPRFHAVCGKAWHTLGCDHAALREFYAAWSSGIEQGASASFFRDWVDTALEVQDLETAEAVLRLYRKLPEGSRKAGPDMRVPEIRLAAARGEEARARGLLGEILAEGAKEMGKDDRIGLFDAAVRIGDWTAARGLWKGVEAECDGKEQFNLLVFWGDEALRRKQPDVALEAYVAVPDGDKTPSVLVRRAVSKRRLGLTGPAKEDLERLSASGDPLFAQAAKTFSEVDDIMASLGKGPSWNDPVAGAGTP
ncbi:MAG: hypothetical protein K6360_07755 [Deltaproteobacteria bacterium]